MTQRVSEMFELFCVCVCLTYCLQGPAKRFWGFLLNLGEPWSFGVSSVTQLLGSTCRGLGCTMVSMF